MNSQVYTLAEFCQQLSLEAIPPEIIDKARLLTIHILGNIIAARNFPHGEMFCKYVIAQEGAREATLVGSKRKYPLTNVVLANCSLAHSLELDDTHNEARTHIGAAIAPSVLAVAEKEGSTGAEFLTAVVLGSEVIARVSKSLEPGTLYIKGYHPSSYCAPFGVAAAAARLMRFTPEQTVNALSLAGLQAAGLLCASEKDSLSWYFQYGKAAQSGIYAAYMTQIGVTGPADIFCGKGGLESVHAPQANMRLLTEGLGQTFALSGLSFKLNSCLHFGQSSVEALLKVLKDNHLSYTQIEKINLNIPAPSITMVKVKDREYPSTMRSAQSNLNYIMAVTAIDGKLTPTQYSPEHLQDSRIRELSRRVEVIPNNKLDSLFPAHWPALVEVITTGGKAYSHQVNDARGDAENPPTLSEIQAIFRELTTGLLSKSQAQTMLTRLSSLESQKDVSSIASILSQAKYQTVFPEVA